MEAVGSWECASGPLHVPECSYWYAIQTRCRHEKMVATQLAGRDVTTFLPLVTHIHRWSDRRKAVQLPLFPGYAFVRIVPTAEERVRVLRVDGVVSFVGVQGEGTPIPDAQIADIHRLLEKVPCTSYPFLTVGQRVRIRGGCLDGIEGILVARNNSRTLVISVQTIQRSLAIPVEGYDIQPL